MKNFKGTEEDKSFVLITSAYNEEDFMSKTIESVLNQTILPAKWVIISDGSVDGTDDIIQEYVKDHSFIEYMRRTTEDKKGHDFASKVHALNSVLAKIVKDNYRFLGILDADIFLPNDYYEELMNRMEENEKYGVLGGMIYETKNGKLIKHDISLNTVCGAIQFFRMNCFKLLGDFLPMRYGGEDSMMCVNANYLGWISKTFTDIKATEQKFVGRNQGSPYKARIARGKVFYDMGYHPFFFILKCIFRIKDEPFLVGSFCEFWGYMRLAVGKTPRTPTPELIRYLRKEQIRRIFRFDTKR